MAMRYPGGLIATSPVNAAYPSGVWTQSQTIPYASQNVWQNDQYWRNTTLLLHGDGTNGAQNNTFLDSSSNNFTITRNGNTTQGTFTPYGSNWSNYFDGSSYLSISTASSTLDFGTGDFTIEMWVNPLTQATSYPTIISCASAWSAGAFYIRYSNTGASNKFGIYWNGVGDPFFVSSSTYQENTWHHVAVTRSGSTVTLWVNGASAGTGTSSASLNLALGSGVWVGNNASASCNYKGYISNLRVVKGTAVYTSAFTPPTAPLTAISGTSLLTCQSNRFIDNSSNQFALTVSGTPSVQAFQPFPGPTTWSASVLGGSGYFDGTGDYLTVETAAESALNLTGTFTFEFWFYRNATGDIQLFSKGGGQNNWNTTNGIAYQALIETSTFKWQFSIGGGSLVSIDVTAPAISQWVHVAVGRNGTTTRVWVNGSSIGTSTSTPTPPSTRNIIYAAANQTGGNNVNGYMAGLRIVNGTDVYGVSNTSITVPTSPPTNISNTSLLLNFTNAGIFDNAQMNDLETVGNAQISTSVVKYGTGSMAFDGTGDWLAGPPTPQTDLGSGDFTLEAWLYRTASGAASDSGIVSRGAPSTLNGFVFGYTSGNVLVFSFNYSGAIVTGVTVIPASTWTHVAVSRNGNTFRLFVNGVLDATATSTNSQTTNAGDIFYVGRSGYDSGRIVTGYLDDVRITKGVARYISNFTPPIARMPNQ